MKRRILFMRSIAGAASAMVFTASGWLMGRGVLTMGGPCGDPSYCDSLGTTTFCACQCGTAPNPCTGYYAGQPVSCRNMYCSNNGAYCGTFCWFDGSCGPCPATCPCP